MRGGIWGPAKISSDVPPLDTGTGSIITAMYAEAAGRLLSSPSLESTGLQVERHRPVNPASS